MSTNVIQTNSATRTVQITRNVSNLHEIKKVKRKIDIKFLSNLKEPLMYLSYQGTDKVKINKRGPVHGGNNDYLNNGTCMYTYFSISKFSNMKLSKNIVKTIIYFIF